MNSPTLKQKEQQLLWEIEQQHRISDSIAHARNETEQIFNVAAPLCVINNDFTIVRVNDTFCDFFSCRKDDITGKPCYTIWESNICTTILCPLKTIMRTGKPYSIEGKIMSGQEEKVCIISASPFYNSDAAITGIVEYFVDITRHKKMELELAEKQKQLEEQNILLSEKNTALRELMRQVEKEKEVTQEHIAANIHYLIQPLIGQMRNCCEGSSSSEYLNCLERNLNELTSPFGKQLSGYLSVLSQKEMSICNMIKNGLTTKDIAQMLHLSEKTIETHRKNIRKKLGITNKQQNLQSVLQSVMSN